MRTLGILLVAGAALFAVLQVLRPGIPVQPATAELQAPPEVKRILQKSCYSCHSGERRLSWFDEMVPAYWLVRQDILTARAHLNFFSLGAKPAASQKAALYEAVNMIQLGAMPLPAFLQLHPEAKVAADELATLKAYLSPWGPVAPPTTLEVPPVSPAAVRAEFNGLAFDPAFKSWKALSTTDRGDNRTFRFILGNDAAVEAAQTGNVSPWPDGARFAKIAWQQEPGADGLVHPGKFLQVEFMVKNARLYRDTQGWGWGRWRGLTLTPYGEDVSFVNECTGCHLPVRGNDYVYTLPVSAAKIGRENVLNNAAALPASLPYQPLMWSVITMYVDPVAQTTATLYGNDTAMQATATRQTALPVYPAGAVLALVTWRQREDPHWFGARIPGAPETVEFVQMAPGGGENVYRRFSGTGLVEDPGAMGLPTRRTNFVLGLAPAQLP